MSTFLSRMAGVVVLSASMVACGGGDFGPPEATRATNFEEDTEGTVFLQLDVYPSEVRAEADSTELIALPQTHFPMDLRVETALDVGELIVREPQIQAGTVVGETLNPFVVAELPGDRGPIPANVFIRREGTVQSYATRTDETGRFAAWVVPAETYDLAVIPDDPMVPMWSQRLPIGNSTTDQDIDLGTGVPIYGQVTAASGPLAGARVHVVDERGFVSGSAQANEFGLYQIRVQPGTFTVVCEGRELGQDPVLTLDEIEADADGVNLDFEYPGPLTKVLAEGRAVSESGPQPVPVTVRFVAESLDGYAEDQATWTWETVAGAQGTFLDRVFPGTYTIEYLPPVVESGPDFAPVRRTGVVIDGSAPLPDVTLPRLTPVDGSVLDASGAFVAGALVDCAEVEFDQRSWFTTTDDEGLWTLDLPGVPLACTVSPPAERTELPRARVELDPSVNTSPTVSLEPGNEVVGSVLRDSEPEAFALVEVRDSRGELLGFGLTDEDGDFEIPVQLSDEDIDTGTATAER